MVLSGWTSVCFSLLASDDWQEAHLPVDVVFYVLGLPKSPYRFERKVCAEPSLRSEQWRAGHPLLSCRDRPPSGALGPPLWSVCLDTTAPGSCGPGPEHPQPLRSCPGWGAAVSLQFLVNSALVLIHWINPVLLYSGGRATGINWAVISQNFNKRHPEIHVPRNTRHHFSACTSESLVLKITPGGHRAVLGPASQMRVRPAPMITTSPQQNQWLDGSPVPKAGYFLSAGFQSCPGPVPLPIPGTWHLPPVGRGPEQFGFLSGSCSLCFAATSCG